MDMDTPGLQEDMSESEFEKQVQDYEQLRNYARNLSKNPLDETTEKNLAQLLEKLDLGW